MQFANMTAAEINRGLASKEFSARELTDSTIERIERLDKKDRSIFGDDK